MSGSVSLEAKSKISGFAKFRNEVFASFGFGFFGQGLKGFYCGYGDVSGTLHFKLANSLCSYARLTHP